MEQLEGAVTFYTVCMYSVVLAPTFLIIKVGRKGESDFAPFSSGENQFTRRRCHNNLFFFERKISCIELDQSVHPHRYPALTIGTHMHALYLSDETANGLVDRQCDLMRKWLFPWSRQLIAIAYWDTRMTRVWKLWTGSDHRSVQLFFRLIWSPESRAGDESACVSSAPVAVTARRRRDLAPRGPCIELQLSARGMMTWWEPQRFLQVRLIGY